MRLRHWSAEHAGLLSVAAIVALIAIHILQNLYFISLDGVFLFSDGYASRAAEVHWLLEEGGLAAYPRFPFPPIVFVVAHFFFKLFGVSLDVARYSQQLFTVILIPSVYYIGLKVAGRRAGFVATVVAASSPLMLNVSRGYFLDYGQTALTALAFALQLATERFSKRGLSLASGLAIGLAMLTKWSALFFLVVPLLLFIGPAFPAGLRSFKGRLLLGWSVGYLVATVVLANLFVGSRLAAPGAAPGLVEYSLHVLLPGAVFLAGVLAVVLTGKRLTADSPEMRLVNFVLTMSIAFVLFAAWAIWSADALIAKAILDASPATSSSNMARGLLAVLSNHTSFALPLLLGGYAITLLPNGRTIEKLAWPLNLLLILPAFLFLGAHPAPRYSLALVICTAVIVANLVLFSNLRWLRNTATVLVLLLSAVSLFGWAFAPAAPLAEVSRDHWELLLHNQRLGMEILVPERPASIVQWRDRTLRPPWSKEESIRDGQLYSLFQLDMARAAQVLAGWDESRVLRINHLNFVDMEAWFQPTVSPRDVLLEQTMRRGRTAASLTLGDKVLGMSLGEMTGSNRAFAVFDGTRVPEHLLVLEAHQFLVLHNNRVDLGPVLQALSEQFGALPQQELSWDSILGYQVTLWQFQPTTGEARGGSLPLLRRLADPFRWRREHAVLRQ